MQIIGFMDAIHKWHWFDFCAFLKLNFVVYLISALISLSEHHTVNIIDLLDYIYIICVLICFLIFIFFCWQKSFILFIFILNFRLHLIGFGLWILQNSKKKNQSSHSASPTAVFIYIMFIYIIVIYIFCLNFLHNFEINSNIQNLNL